MALNSTWQVNGVPLEDTTRKWTVEHSTGLPSAQGRKVSLLELPFTDGQIASRGGLLASTVAISVFVDNPEAGKSVERLWQSISQLQALVGQATTLGFVHGDRRFEAEVYKAEVSEPELVGGGVAGARVQLQFTTGPGWKDMSGKVTASLSGGINDLRTFAGSGPVLDAVITVEGSASKVEVSSRLDKTSIIFNTVRSRATFDVGSGKVTGASSWDYGRAGLLRVEPVVTKAGAWPVLIVTTSGGSPTISISGSKFWR